MKAAERYRALVADATRSGTMWVLSQPDGDAWATYADPRGHVVIPVWPSREDAALMATGKWGRTVPTGIRVSEFLDHEVDALEADGVQLAAHPTPTSSGAAVRAAHFARALREALR